MLLAIANISLFLLVDRGYGLHIPSQIKRKAIFPIGNSLSNQTYRKFKPIPSFADHEIIPAVA